MIADIEGVKIILPIGLPKPDKLTGGYQYWLQEESLKGVRHHLTATVRAFRKHLTQRHERFLHPFGGLGATAQIIDAIRAEKGWPSAIHTFWERDEVCVQSLQDFGWLDVNHVQDSYQKLTNVDYDNYDVIILDVTAGTIKSPNMVLIWKLIRNWIDEDKHRFVWNVDSACSKIWLHREHYIPELGRRVEDADDYIRAYDEMLKVLGIRIWSAWREATVVYTIVGSSDADCRYGGEIERIE